MGAIRVLSLFCIGQSSAVSVDCVPHDTLGPHGTKTPSHTDFVEGDFQAVDFFEVIVLHFWWCQGE